jgi:hypothetical protein
MKKVKDRLVQIAMLGLLGVSITFTVGQIAMAQTIPACAGLACASGEDCGTKCFCNRPSRECISDGDIILE